MFGNPCTRMVQKNGKTPVELGDYKMTYDKRHQLMCIIKHNMNPFRIYTAMMMILLDYIMTIYGEE